MKPYIYTARDKVHIFDLVKTKEGMEKAADFVRETVAKGGKIMFVGTKKQAKGIIKENGLKLGMPYVSERWIGGTLTNWEHIKRSLDQLRSLKKDREEEKFKELTKKERLLIDRKILRLEKIFGGLISLEKIPEAVFIIDIKKEAGAAKEARMRGVAVIGMVDTNSDPDLVDIVIPANDDANKSIKLIVDFIMSAAEEGKEELKSRKPVSSADRPKDKSQKEEGEEKAIEEGITKEEPKLKKEGKKKTERRTKTIKSKSVSKTKPVSIKASRVKKKGKDD
jgi:small subunit ribosomal protein S2